MARTRAAARPLTDHDEIRRWAEERNASPACVKGTGGGHDVGMIRLDFPGYGGEESLQEIGWDDWFDKFEERNLALLVQDETAQGKQSNFNKLVSRNSGADRDRGRSSRRSTTTRTAAARTSQSASNADEEIDVEEEFEMELLPRSGRTQSSGRQPGRQKSTRSSRTASRPKTAVGRGSSKRGQKRTSASNAPRPSVRSRSAVSGKKPAGQARTAQSRSSRGRSRGRRRAA